MHSVIQTPTPLQALSHALLREKGISLFMKRDDLTHPDVQGNKWRKLKYNLEFAKANNYASILTFGGPMSNHIYSTAAAGKLFGLKTIGVIRGYAHLPLTPTLAFAKAQGMEFHFLSKAEYEHRFSESTLEELKQTYGEFYAIPDGGSNALAVKGVAEMMQEIDIDYDVCCVAMGTGGTTAGCVAGSKGRKVIGFSSLKGEGNLSTEVERLVHEYSTLENAAPVYNWTINYDYHFGGYGKVTDELLAFVQQFEKEQNILLDPVYTSKMMFGVFDLIEKDYFVKGTKIVAIHTGGLQGWRKNNASKK
ncbi:MAG: 1-aminocyclopropane-1-carboxylate deaminase/D-cysteine desulfhydrase [Chitinophagales bacterium]|nr:1-aminocyclopropane-1-carboxylate deaminase/D-cysteine desulfhydrase [Chitinophagales bacterium]